MCLVHLSAKQKAAAWGTYAIYFPIKDKNTARSDAISQVQNFYLMPLRISFLFGVHHGLSPTQPGVRLTTCRPISLANLQSMAAPMPSRKNLLAWKTKTGSREGKHGASTGQAEPGARRTHVQNPTALGRLGRQHVNAACSAAGRGDRRSARALSL